jgi:hypothetical protein
MIKNKPIINEDPKDALLRKKQDELEILKAQIRRMALNYDPKEMVEMKDVSSSLNTKGSQKIRKKNNIDLSEMEKENLKVLEDKENLTKNLKRKAER